MSRFGRVRPSAGRHVIDRKACFLSLLAQAAVWLLELRVSQHFSTFYGPSVQAIDAQLNAPSTLPVLARTVSGCLNSAFSRHFYTFYELSVQTMDTQVTRQRSGTGRPSVEGDGPARRPCLNQRNKPHRKENARQSQLCSMPAWCSRVMPLPAAHWRPAMAKGLATVRDGESGGP